MKSLKVCPCGYLSNQFWPGSGLVIRCPSPGVPVSLFWLLGEGLFFFILYDVSACGKYAKSLCPPLLSWVPGCGAAWGARGRGRQCHQHHLQYSHATCGMCHQHVTCVTSMSYHILFSSVRGCMLSVHNTHTHTRTHTHTHARTHTHTHTHTHTPTPTRTHAHRHTRTHAPHPTRRHLLPAARSKPPVAWWGSQESGVTVRGEG